MNDQSIILSSEEYIAAPAEYWRLVQHPAMRLSNPEELVPLPLRIPPFWRALPDA